MNVIYARADAIRGTHSRDAAHHARVKSFASLPRRRLLLALISVLGAGTPLYSLRAMDFHVNGHQIILSGDVHYSDGYILADLMARLKAQGRTIDTLVMRNSNGGAVLGGYDIADIARRNQLKTVASGYCISACSMMFVGGVERAFDAGPNKDVVDQQNIQIHGMARNGKYVTSDRTTDFYWHFVNAIAGGDLTQTDPALLDKAFSSTTLALLWDPTYGKNPSVYWGKQGTNEYEAFPQDDVYTTKFITQHTPESTTDAITLTGQSLSGNINPNFYNPYDPHAKRVGITNRLYTMFYGPLLVTSPPSGDLTKTSQFVDLELAAYDSLSPSARKAALTKLILDAQFSQAETAKYLAIINEDSDKPLVDTQGISIDDAWDIMHLVNSPWTLSSGERVAMGALQLTDSALHLHGGTVDIANIRLDGKSVLDGEGQIGEGTLWAKIRFSDDAVLRPSGRGIDWVGNPRLEDRATLSLDISASQAKQPALLRFGLFDGDSYTSTSGLSIRSKAAQLGLRIAPGFYRSGETYALVGYTANFSERLDAATQAGKAPDYTDIVFNRFTHVVRTDAQGSPLAGYDIDPTAQDTQQSAFHPFENSLVTYHVRQSGNGISLVVDDAFLDNRKFCGLAGCGLGMALSHASQQGDTPLAPLLGALQFSTTTQAAQAREQLEGAGYAAQRSASLNLINDFNQTVNLHLLSTDHRAEQVANVAVAMAVPIGLGRPGRSIDAAGMLRYLVAPDDSIAGASSGPPSGPILWGRLFGYRARLDGQGEVSALRQNSTGLIFGLDQRADEHLTWGGSLGYGKLSTEGAGSGFRGRTRAVDARLYLNYASERHYVNLLGGLTHLSTSVTRKVDLSASQLPFVANARARDTGTALSLHFEHGWTLRDRHGWTWQPILPAMDLVRLPAVNVRDRATDPAIALKVQAKKVLDARLGMGVQVAKTFDLASGMAIAPHARVVLQHAFRDHAGYFTNSFANDAQGVPFAVRGPDTGLNHAQVNLGVTAHHSNRLAVLADYIGDFTRHSRDQGVALGVQYRW